MTTIILNDYLEMIYMQYILNADELFNLSYSSPIKFDYLSCITKNNIHPYFDLCPNIIESSNDSSYIDCTYKKDNSYKQEWVDIIISLINKFNIFIYTHTERLDEINNFKVYFQNKQKQ